MLCRICGGEVDDPFWDLYCDECLHAMGHARVECFDSSCSLCIAEEEDEHGLEPDEVDV